MDPKFMKMVDILRHKLGFSFPIKLAKLPALAPDSLIVESASFKDFKVLKTPETTAIDSPIPNIHLVTPYMWARSRTFSF